MKSLINEMKNKLVRLGNKAEQKEKRICDTKDRTLAITQEEEVRESRIMTKMKDVYQNYLSPLERAI